MTLLKHVFLIAIMAVAMIGVMGLLTDELVNCS